MKVFISCLGTAGWASRKVLGEYDLPIELGLTSALLKARACDVLSNNYNLNSGVLFDLAGNGIGRSALAIAALSRPPISIPLNSRPLTRTNGVTEASCPLRFSKIERAWFEKMPLTRKLFDQNRFAQTFAPPLFLREEADNPSISLDDTAARNAFYLSQLAEISEGNLAPQKCRGPVSGLLLSLNPSNPDHPSRQERDLYNSIWASGLSQLERDSKDLVLSHPDGFQERDYSKQFVLYPDIERGNNFLKWQTWLRDLMQYLGYELLRSGSLTVRCAHWWT